MTNEKFKTENCFIVNKNWKSTLLEDAIFCIFPQNFEKSFFSITNSGLEDTLRKFFFASLTFNKIPLKYL